MEDDFKRKKSDYLFELALEEQLEHDVDLQKYKLEDNVENPHVFSEKYNKHMKKLMKKAYRIENRSLRMRRYAQFAAGFILFFSFSITAITQVEAVRMPIIRFISQVKEKYTFFDRSDEFYERVNNKVVNMYKEYEPKYVPHNFSISNVMEGDDSLCIKYTNDKEQKEYIFWFFEDKRGMGIDTEDAETVEIEIEGNKVYVIQKKDKIRVLMYQGDHQFYLGGTLSYEDAIKIMESIN